MTPTDIFNALRDILVASAAGDLNLNLVKGGAAELAHWFGCTVSGGTYAQYEELCALAGTQPSEWCTAPKRVSVEPRQHERLPPAPRAAAARLVQVMLRDIGQRLDADTAPELLLPDLDAVRVMVTHHGLHPDITTELNQLYAQCEPVPEPTFTSWNREYRANIGKPWETVVTYPNHAEAHRGLIKARAECPGQHRIIGVVA